MYQTNAIKHKNYHNTNTLKHKCAQFHWDELRRDLLLKRAVNNWGQLINPIPAAIDEPSHDNPCPPGWNYKPKTMKCIPPSVRPAASASAKKTPCEEANKPCIWSAGTCSFLKGDPLYNMSEESCKSSGGKWEPRVGLKPDEQMPFTLCTIAASTTDQCNNVSEKCFPCNNYTPPPITPTPKQNLPEGRCACFPGPSPCEDCTKDKPYCNEFDPDTPPYAGVCSSYFNNKNPKGNERSGNCRWNAACKSGRCVNGLCEDKLSGGKQYFCANNNDCISNNCKIIKSDDGVSMNYCAGENSDAEPPPNWKDRPDLWPNVPAKPNN